MKMKRRDLLRMVPLAALPYGGLRLGRAQQDEGIIGNIIGRRKTWIAVPDFRGRSVPAALMDTLNATIWSDLQDAGVLALVAKTNYPLSIPETPDQVNLEEWAKAPVSTQYLGIGYAQGTDVLELRGSLLNVTVDNIASGSIFANRPYFGTMNEAGAIKVAHEYASDIMKQLGVQSLAGSKIYFISDRSGEKEVWSMDYDGKNQLRMTGNRTLSKNPVVSPDGSLLAYVMQDSKLFWSIRVLDPRTGQRKPFVGPTGMTIVTPEFSPDGQQVWYSMVIDDYLQIVRGNADGSGRQRVSNIKAIEVEPRVNPKTGKEVLFISGRGGPPQLYRMNSDGGGAIRLTDGTGDVANPSWSPDGRKIAFCWTRGFAPGNFNIFVADADGRNLVQLTHGNGSNESPWWAPDGVHIVFSNKRGSGNAQLYSMLADGTRVKQLTSAGNNLSPMWAPKVE